MRHSLAQSYFIGTLILLCATACNHVSYQATPISIDETRKKIFQKSPTSESFVSYLIAQGYAVDLLPISEWNIETLYHSALFHHSALDLSKAQLGLAQANLILAGQRPAFGVGGKIGQAKLGNDDVSDKVFNLQFEIPVITANKLEIRIEEAEQQLEVARLHASAIAWQLRHQLSLDLIDYEENQQTIVWLDALIENQARLLALLQKRLQMGLASSVDVMNVEIELQKRNNQRNQEQHRTQQIVAKMAADAGLTIEQFHRVKVARTDVETVTEAQTHAIDSLSLQREMLFNRIDIQSGLASYAAAEAKLKLEIAKQIPDINLVPSYVFELGDQIFSLGFNSLLGLINPQQTAFIQQAEQLRNVEGAKFESLQTSLISQLSITETQYKAALARIEHIRTTHAMEHAKYEKTQKQFNAGFADKLTLYLAKQSLLLSSQQYTTSQFECLRAQSNIENMLQTPLLIIGSSTSQRS